MENSKNCIICDKVFEEGEQVFEAENSAGENVCVCSNCCYSLPICEKTQKRITRKRARDSYALHNIPLALSWVNSHPNAFETCFFTKKQVLEGGLKDFIFVDKDLKLKKIKGLYHYLSDFCDETGATTSRCVDCNSIYIFENGEVRKKYYNEYLKNFNSFYCNDCKKRKKFAPEFLSGKFFETKDLTKYEGHNVLKRVASEFKELYRWTNVLSYGFKPEFLPKTKARKIENFAGFGFELETEGCLPYNDEEEDLYYDDDEKKNSTLQPMFIDLLNSFGELFYFKNDGSLDDEEGVEIVTRAADFDFWKTFDFEKFTKILKGYDRVSGQHEGASDCGMHIHASRLLFGKTEKSRINNIAKILLFFKKFEEELTAFCGRDYNSYCRALDFTSAYIFARQYAANGSGFSRYHCINLCNKDTVEFRLFDGTTDPEIIKTNLEFLFLLITETKKQKHQKDFLNAVLIFKNASEFLQKRLKKAGMLKCV